MTDTYEYNAYGVVLDQSGDTANSYLYTGEQFDASQGNYYLRARYYDPANGRFTQMDSFLGFENDPVTLHKYLYANVSPIHYTDPSGNISILSALSNIGRLAMTGVRATSSAALMGARVTSRFVVNNISHVWSRSAGFLTRMRGAANGVRMMQRHFKRWTNSKNFKRSIGVGNHYIELQLPSGRNKSTKKTIVNRIRFGKKYRITVVSGGKTGRVFQISYGIGKNAARNPSRIFRFRLDYLMHDSGVGSQVFNLHYHIMYNNVNLNHVPLK